MRSWTMSAVIASLVGVVVTLQGCDGDDDASACGDGRVNLPVEQCEPTDLMGESCETLGYYGGFLYCNSQCQFDTTHCAQSGRCGDGIIQSGTGEECDGADLGNATCASLGHRGGTLVCGADCRFDVSGCESCGDGVIQAASGEECDGQNLNSQTCEGLGHHGGTLSCLYCSFDHSGCRLCGDGVCDPEEDPTSCSNDCTAPGTYLAAGSSHSCTISQVDDSVWCWGRAEEGQLGNGTYDFSTQSSPVLVTGISDALAVTGGFRFTCVLRATGAVQCFGDEWLGDSASQGSNTPVTVSGISNGVAVSKRCVLLADSTVKCWGQNSSGQVGDGSTTDRPAPVSVVGLSGIVDVSAGGHHGCAVLSGGSMSCWGRNDAGQLGDGSYDQRPSPVSVIGLSDAVSVSAGGGVTCAVVSSGAVWCWGANSSGQLGNGNQTGSPVPVAVTGITTAVAVSTGSAHACALLTDGTIRCWGENTYGQLGDGTNDIRLTPTPVSQLSGVVEVASGNDHTCALKDDWTRWCWGANRSAQLGDGSYAPSPVPIQVSF